MKSQFEEWISSLDYSYEKLPVLTKAIMCKWIAHAKSALNRSVIANSFEAANIILFNNASSNDSYLTEASND